MGKPVVFSTRSAGAWVTGSLRYWEIRLSEMWLAPEAITKNNCSVAAVTKKIDLAIWDRSQSKAAAASDAVWAVRGNKITWLSKPREVSHSWII